MVVKASQRYDSLDGLRGVAALAVLLGHISPEGETNIVPLSSLAVDLFFLLSGFVIGSAYEQRLLEEMSMWKFFERRMIRLYPMIFLAIVTGAIGYYKVYSPGLLMFLFVTGLFLIPTPYGAASEDHVAFALAPPSWSLLFEIAANVVYASLIKRLNARVLILILLASALSLI